MATSNRFHAKGLYLSHLHLYLQKMFAIILEEFKVKLDSRWSKVISYVELIFLLRLVCVRENFLTRVVVRTDKKDLILPASLMSFEMSFQNSQRFLSDIICYLFQSLFTLLLLMLLPFVYVFIYVHWFSSEDYQTDNLEVGEMNWTPWEDTIFCPHTISSECASDLTCKGE